MISAICSDSDTHISPKNPQNGEIWILDRTSLSLKNDLVKHAPQGETNLDCLRSRISSAWS
jgi:hypothetical protein